MSPVTSTERTLPSSCSKGTESECVLTGRRADTDSTKLSAFESSKAGLDAIDLIGSEGETALDDDLLSSVLSPNSFRFGFTL